MTFKIGDKVRTEFDGGITEHVVIGVKMKHHMEMLQIDPPVECGAIPGMYDWIRSGWFVLVD